MERRLAALFAADVVGYSRLMGEDEAGTLERVKSLHKELVQPTITERNGRIVKLMGDGLLAEFSSIVDAVQCAADIQQSMMMRETDLPEERRVRLRIGVNLGDVIVEGSDIFGDGVNVAVRLEGLAEPGGVCVSGPAFDTVEGKLEIAFEDIGPKQVKNMVKPVHVYKLVLDGRKEHQPAQAGNSSALREKPSIAVLPFTNLSGDPEQEYFADGITEDITTALSRFHELTVIARNTSFTFKGQSVNAREIAQALSVKYILEGSIRHAANRVRVNVQLIDATDDRHIWAERYDRELDDIFSVQDEITQKTVASVAPETQQAEMVAAYRKDIVDLTSWERVMRARWHLDKFTRKDIETAEVLLAEAIDFAPDLAEAFSTLAVCHVYKMFNAWCDDPVAEIAAAGKAAKHAVAFDAGDANALAVMGLAALLGRKFDECLDLLEQAIAKNPNLASAYGFMTTAYGLMGECDKAFDAFDIAMTLSPKDQTRVFWMAGKGIALVIDGRYKECIKNAHVMLRVDPAAGTAHRHLAACFAMLGRMDEAEAAMADLRAHMPNLTIAQVAKMVPVKDPAHNERWLDSLRKAGLPE